MRLVLIAILSIFISAGIAGNKISAQPGKDSANSRQSDANQNPPGAVTPTPTATLLSQSRPDSPKGESPDNHRQQSEQSAEDSAWLTSWIQAIVAMLLFIVVIWQTHISNQQRKIMQKQIEMAEGVERGYVGIGDMKVSNLVVGQRPIVTVIWVNGGRTPVRNFRAMPVLIFNKEPRTNEIRFIDDDISPISGSFFPVGAEREVKYEQTKRVSETELKDFQSGKLNIYIIGTMVYRDINGKRQVEEIFAMYDRADEYVYEAYEYSKPDSDS